jgi:hypothetical protein
VRLRSLVTLGSADSVLRQSDPVPSGLDLRIRCRFSSWIWLAEEEEVRAKGEEVEETWRSMA